MLDDNPNRLQRSKGRQIMAEKAYLAIDMGASSGRHVIGRLRRPETRLEEVYRFENGPVDMAGRLHWDLLGPVDPRPPGPRGRGRRAPARRSPASASTPGASISACWAAATSCWAIPITTATAAPTA